MIWRERIFTAAIKKWGKELQCIVAIEELAELQQAVTKQIRHERVGQYDAIATREHLAEEIADARLMIDQVEYMYGLNVLTNDFYGLKFRRLAALLEVEDE